MDAVDRLREPDRLVIVYRYFLDLSEKETAEILGCPRGTVKSRLSRALARLKDDIGDRFELGAVPGAAIGGGVDE
jgi:RNA polymerase sigma factor (sigma-70 family)